MQSEVKQGAWGAQPQFAGESDSYGGWRSRYAGVPETVPHLIFMLK